jgi:hypothetical protein
MKTLTIFILSIFLISSCATTAEFPVSDITPAAKIKSSINKDKNGNYKISVVADNLSSAERLNPPKNVYVVWITTALNGTKNIGQLKNKNAQKATLQALTAFEPEEIFITAEEEGNISYASGPVISRISVGDIPGGSTFLQK